MEGAHRLEHQANLAVLTQDFSLAQGEQEEQGELLAQGKVLVQVSHHLMDSQRMSKLGTDYALPFLPTQLLT